MDVDELTDRINALEQHAAVTDERVQYRSAERSADFLLLSKLIDQQIDLRVNVRVLETRLAIYAALGSFAGGGAISIIVNILLDVIRH